MLNPTAELLQKIEKVVAQEPQYKPEAHLFVLAALQFTVRCLPQPRHVTGKELLKGIRLYALDQFGPLAIQVFEHWGIKTTEDFGRIVFALVEAKLLRKTEEDTLEDFKGGYSFSDAFNPQPLFKLTDEGNPSGVP